ncbi:hypothetical protein V495_08088 [Pseudogymnoascus sp. VKM F-4514 (FW-929)]|nr:hypothetical protein V495_08088 [Pseudogymnoascus sp. VKM F-4514 (FW-929)]
MMEKLEEKPVSVAPLLEKREEEREEREEREEKEEILEERVDEKKHRLLGKRDGSPKEKEKAEREKGEKRARRGRSRRSEEKDDPEGVGCSAGCFQMLGRNG